MKKVMNDWEGKKKVLALYKLGKINLAKNIAKTTHASPGPRTNHSQPLLEWTRTGIQKTTRSFSLGGTQLGCFYLVLLQL